MLTLCPVSADLPPRLGEDLRPVLGQPEEGSDRRRGDRGHWRRLLADAAAAGRCSRGPRAHVVLSVSPPAAAEQRDGVRVFPGGVPAAAGGVLVQVLRLLPAVPGGPVHAAGPDREPAHRHGVSAEEGNDGAAKLSGRDASGFL